MFPGTFLATLLSLNVLLLFSNFLSALGSGAFFAMLLSLYVSESFKRFVSAGTFFARRFFLIVHDLSNKSFASVKILFLARSDFLTSSDKFSRSVCLTTSFAIKASLIDLEDSSRSISFSTFLANRASLVFG